MVIEELKDRALVAAAQRFAEHATKIQHAFRDATSGRIEKVESNERIRKYVDRQLEHWSQSLARGGEEAPPNLSELGMERVIGHPNIVSVEFLEEGQQAARAVGRVNVAEIESATGCLIGHGLVITNKHVLPDRDRASFSTFELDFERQAIGPTKRLQVFEFDPDRFFWADDDHDVTITAVRQQSDSGADIGDWGYHPLIGKEGKILIGHPVNIVQHPHGRMKALCVHDSRFMFLENDGELDQFCWYTGDTEPGSSGSPVFNNRWEVVAIHHKAVPKVNDRKEVLDRNNKPLSKADAEDHPERVQWVANEGIRTSRIVKALKSASLDARMAEERSSLLALWQREDRTPAALESRRATEVGTVPQEAPRSADAGSSSPRLVTAPDVVGSPGLPITITIRVG